MLQYSAIFGLKTDSSAYFLVRVHLTAKKFNKDRDSVPKQYRFILQNINN
jgi:hypothetical protein